MSRRSKRGKPGPGRCEHPQFNREAFELAEQRLAVDPAAATLDNTTRWVLLAMASLADDDYTCSASPRRVGERAELLMSGWRGGAVTR